MTARPARRRDEVGQISLLIIGMATILLIGVAVVVDASAAYLQRQGLNTLADGAALYGADRGARAVHLQGLDDRLPQVRAQVEQGVAEYLRNTRAADQFPGLQARVTVEAGSNTVRVTLRAPLDLPLSVPGSPEAPQVAAQGAAVVTVRR